LQNVNNELSQSQINIPTDYLPFNEKDLEYEKQIQELLIKIAEKDSQIEELIEVQKETSEVFNIENTEELRKMIRNYENTISKLHNEIEEKNLVLVQVRKELKEFKRKSVSKRKEDIITPEDLLAFTTTLEKDLENSVNTPPIIIEPKDDSEKEKISLKLNEIDEQLKKQSSIIYSVNTEIEKQKSNSPITSKTIAKSQSKKN